MTNAISDQWPLDEGSSLNISNKLGFQHQIKIIIILIKKEDIIEFS